MPLLAKSLQHMAFSTQSSPSIMLAKVTIAAFLTIFGLVATWWALDLAMWTAVKDFREDCREELQNFNYTSIHCQDTLSRPLRPPPTFDLYLGKATNGMLGASPFRACRGSADGTASTCSGKRYYLASKSASPSYDSVHDEFEAFFEPSSVRKQEDSAILYGGHAPWTNSTIAFPLLEEAQEWHDELWLTYGLYEDCSLWINETVVGSVKFVGMYDVPDQRDEPGGFQNVIGLMPSTTQEWWLSQCVYPTIPTQDPPSSKLEIITDWLDRVEVSHVLGVTVFVVAMAHEVICGGFARKTKFKWQ